MVAITALNGALPASAVTFVWAGYTLRHDAAASYLRARTDGCPAGITTAYRTKDQQKSLLALYGYPRAEYPGKSQHGEGVALDLPEPARSWLAANGRAYGWIRTLSFEPWHFEYIPARDTHRTATLPDPLPEDDMPYTTEQLASIARSGVLEIVRSEEFRQRIKAIVLDALPPATPGAIDYAALAKAVNDDAARRMQA